MNVVESAAAPERPCRLLGIDTATEHTSISLVLPDRVLTIDAQGGAQASETLLADLRELLEQGGCRLGDLDAIAFGRGPGAFTGLRTTCSVVQGLAFGAQKPVLPVDSLMLVAESVRHEMLARGAQGVWVVQDARMDEIYAARYRWQGERAGRWQTLVAPALYAIDTLNRLWSAAAAAATPDAGEVALAGSALPVMGERLHCGAALRLATVAGSGRAQALARLAVSGFSDGDLLDATQAVPLYLRDKVAQTTAEREAARAATAA